MSRPGLGVAAVGLLALLAGALAPFGGGDDGPGRAAMASLAPQLRQLGVALDPLAGLLLAHAIGDPHLQTFDGVTYDFQGAGEYVLWQMVGGDDGVQVRYEPRAGSEVVSVTTAVVASVGGRRVQVTRDDDAVLVDGDAMSGSEADLGGGAVRIDGTRVVVTWPSGAGLVVSREGEWLSTNAGIPPAWAGKVEGLLGDADGDPSGDLRPRGGEPFVPGGASREQLYDEFGDSWRVTPTTSWFRYESGTTTDTYTDRSFPSAFARLDTLEASVRQEADAACRSRLVVVPASLEACTLDVALTGDEGFAEDAARTQPLARYDVELGDTVAPDEPGEGAGRMTGDGTWDGFAFVGRSGQRVAVDATDGCQLDATAVLFDERGAEVGRSALASACADAGLVVVLPADGSYLLAVGGGRSAGTYAFRFAASAPPHTTPCNQVVSTVRLTPDDPSAEVAGSLQAPGYGKQCYTAFRVDVSEFRSGGTIAIEASVRRGDSAGSFDLFPPGSRLPKDGRPTGVAAYSYDVPAGSTTKLVAELERGGVLLFGASGNWLSAQGAVSPFSATITMRP